MERHYIEVPGSGTHELPPLLVRNTPEKLEMEEVVGMATSMVDDDDLLAAANLSEAVREQRKFDLAVHLAEQYSRFVFHWQWGESILEWVRQCLITFEGEQTLRGLMHPDVWPHANRASFVTLLAEKHVPTPGVPVEKAVGLRLAFRQPPPISCCSNQFLYFLNSAVGDSAYHSWAQLSESSQGLLPPNRFHFLVLDTAA